MLEGNRRRFGSGRGKRLGLEAQREAVEQYVYRRITALLRAEGWSVNTRLDD